MQTEYQARWISKSQLDRVRRSGGLARALALDGFNGLLIIEPVGSGLGDGPILALDEADYELRPAWCREVRAKLCAARKLLRLEADPQPVLPA